MVLLKIPVRYHVTSAISQNAGAQISIFEFEYHITAALSQTTMYKRNLNIISFKITQRFALKNIENKFFSSAGVSPFLREHLTHVLRAPGFILVPPFTYELNFQHAHKFNVSSDDKLGNFKNPYNLDYAKNKLFQLIAD
jgi:hypothetical protein